MWIGMSDAHHRHVGNRLRPGLPVIDLGGKLIHSVEVADGAFHHGAGLGKAVDGGMQVVTSVMFSWVRRPSGQ